MSFRRHRTGILTFTASAIWAGALLGFAYWPPPDQVVQYSALILATILTRALAAQRAAAKDWVTAPPSFVIDFASLLFLGANATMLVASAGVVTQSLADSRRQDLPRRMFFNLATAMVAIHTAGIVHRMLGGTLAHFIWPDQGLPIAAAVI